jgi:predicted enzyme related to lactoylglutathione lyase
MFKKVAFTYYPVTDVARARKFYEETLGLKSGSAGNQGDNWWVEYDLPGGGCLALTNFTKEKPSDTAGGTIAFEVEDLDRLMTDLKGKAVTFKSAVIESPVSRMAVCLDSGANLHPAASTQVEMKLASTARRVVKPRPLNMS